MKMIKFVAATALASVAFLGMTLEPAAARSGGGFSWGSSNAQGEINPIGEFVLLLEDENGDPIFNESPFPEFDGIFRDAVLYNGNKTPEDLRVETVKSGNNGVEEIAFLFDGLTLQLRTSSMPSNTGEINDLLGRATVVDGRNGDELTNILFNDLGAVDVPVDVPADDPTIPVEQVPEPATILGSLMAVGVGGVLKKTAAKKKEVSSVK